MVAHHEHRVGVFRVDYRTEFMSICYVIEDRVVCTQPENIGKWPQRLRILESEDVAGSIEAGSSR